VPVRISRISTWRPRRPRRPRPPGKKPAARIFAAKRVPATDEPQAIAYRHAGRRANNPETGKTRWAYDPHLDPALQFDSGRAGIESLIDNALASGEQATMQTPCLNWNGKAERTCFEVDTVRLHTCTNASTPPASCARRRSA